MRHFGINPNPNRPKRRRAKEAADHVRNAVHGTTDEVREAAIVELPKVKASALKSTAVAHEDRVDAEQGRRPAAQDHHTGAEGARQRGAPGREALSVIGSEEERGKESRAGKEVAVAEGRNWRVAPLRSKTPTIRA
jgi:hypothetical protein